MNETKTKYLIITLITIIFILFTTLAIVLTNHRTRKQPEPQQNTIIVTDTLTNIVYDTVYLERYKTVKLPTTDTIVIDSLIIDSVFVQVPISTYKLDTTFTSDSTRLDLHIINSGFDVSLDTLSYKFTYQPTPPVIKKKRHRFGIFVGPAVGISYDWTTGKVLPSVGIGIGVGWSVGKY